MKILFCPCHYVYDDADRGSELSWAYQIADTISRKNPNSVVVTGFKNIKYPKKYKIVELQNEKDKIDLGLINTFKFNYLYTKYLVQTIRKENFDVVHHVLPFAIDRTFNLALILWNFKNTQIIIGPIQSPLPFYNDNTHDIKANPKLSILNYFTNIFFGVLSPIFTYLSNKTLQRAAKLIVINTQTKKLLVNRSIKSEKIIVIPPGVSTKKYTPAKNAVKCKIIEIVVVGNLIERKGVALVLKGVAEMLQYTKNFKFTILGDGPQKVVLSRLVNELQIQNYVTFAGHIAYSEIPKFYKKAHILVSMSYAEGFATICLEAMASGLAIVSTKVGGFQDAIRDGENGYLVKPGDYSGMARKLLYLIENPELIEKMGKKNRLDAVNKYDWESIIMKQYKSIYLSLIKDI